MDEKNKYDVAIERLLAAEDFKKAVYRAWEDPAGDESGCLFSFVTPNSNSMCQGKDHGCLTQVKLGLYPAYTEALTKAIREDERIPDKWDGITPETLPVFKEWQERIDKELNRT